MGIKESISGDLSLFPNPTRGLLEFNLGTFKIQKVQLFSLAGSFL